MQEEIFMIEKNILMCFVFLLVMMPQGNLVVSQTQQQNAEVRPFTDLTFEITVPTQTLLPLEPIPIIIKQSNRTNQPVLGYNSISFGRAPIYLYVQKIGGEKRTIISQFTPVKKFIDYKNIEILPGASYEAKEWITLGLNIDFPESGIYELKAVLANDKRTQVVNSNTLNIEIQEPTGTEREVYNLIRNSSSKEYLFSGVEFDKVKNILEKISTRHPNSIYAKSSFYVLGELYFQRRQYPLALTNLIKLENDSDFIFTEKVINYLAAIRRSMQTQQTTEGNQ
jgi:hypothetical protein